MSSNASRDCSAYPCARGQGGQGCAFTNYSISCTSCIPVRVTLEIAKPAPMPPPSVVYDLMYKLCKRGANSTEPSGSVPRQRARIKPTAATHRVPRACSRATATSPAITVRAAGTARTLGRASANYARPAASRQRRWRAVTGPSARRARLGSFPPAHPTGGVIV